MTKTYFLDENLSWRIGQAVKLLVESPRCRVLVVQDELQGIKDHDLVPLIGRTPGAFLITEDTSMASRAQRDMLNRHQVGAFFLAQVGVREQAVRILRAWPAIEHAADEMTPPFRLHVRQGGTLGRKK